MRITLHGHLAISEDIFGCHYWAGGITSIYWWVDERIPWTEEPGGLQSSFLQQSAFLLIAFLNSFSIFIIPLLNSVSVRLKKSVSLFVLSREFSVYFSWEWFLCFFLLLIFLLLYELRKSN